MLLQNCGDLGIVLIAAYLYGAQTGLYCILGMILKCTVVDSAIESLNLRKVCTIISKYPDQVEDFIINVLQLSKMPSVFIPNRSRRY